MPDTTNAPTPTESRPDSPDTSAPTATGPQVHPVEYPEAPPDSGAAGGNQLDILLDMDVPLTAVLGTTQIPVRRLLQLGPGSVLRLEKPIEAPADLFLKEAKFAEADVVVVENQFAIRIKRILGAGTPAQGVEA